MMFQASLETVSTRLAEARSSADRAILQLSSIEGLTWQTTAGKAFTEQSAVLSGKLQELTK